MKLNSRFKEPNNKSACKNILLRALFSHVGLFILVAVYSIAGAYLMILLELPAEEERFSIKRQGAHMLNEGKKYIIAKAWYHTYPKTDEIEFNSMMRNNLILYRKAIIKTMKEEYYDGNKGSWYYDWTISNSLLYTVTTIGAIGYGNIYPQTSLGQFFTVYYAMIGIPLLLLFLANIGDLMASAMRYIYSRMCCRWCRARRRVADIRDRQVAASNMLLRQDEVGSEAYMPTNEVSVPIMVNLAFITVYLACGGIFFRYAESWKLYEACYFCFITLTTIGFGDYVPGTNINAGGESTALSSIKFLITIFYSIFGMALLSMSINLMKTQIVGNSKWLAYEIGIVEEDYDPTERYQIKLADEDGMIITPAGKDGNKHDLLYNAEDDFTLPQE